MKIVCHTIYEHLQSAHILVQKNINDIQKREIYGIKK